MSNLKNAAWYRRPVAVDSIHLLSQTSASQTPRAFTFHNKSPKYTRIHCLNAYKSHFRPKILLQCEPASRSSTQFGWRCCARDRRLPGLFLTYSHPALLALTQPRPFSTRLSLQRTRFWNARAFFYRRFISASLIVARYHCAHSYFKALKIIPGYKKKNVQSWRLKRESPCNINDTRLVELASTGWFSPLIVHTGPLEELE